MCTDSLCCRAVSHTLQGSAMSRYRAQIIGAAVLVILAIIGIFLVVLPAKEVTMPADNMYGIVLDAGSSHTSMFIYKWPADKQNGTGVVTQHSECDAKGGGISSYAGKPGDAAKSLEECMNHALKEIPKSRQHQTPLCLGATAGMRLLKEINQTESDKVLKEVRDKLSSYPFQFKEAKILSGQEEGAYGWVTVNYLLEKFIKYDFVGHWLNPGRNTIGALDLGGASTQITFETSQNLENPDNQMNLTLYGQAYTLYTHSFLCYGQDQFLKRLLAHLIQTQGVLNQVINPCYPPKFNISINLGKDVFDSFCTKKYKPANLDAQRNVTVVGSGNYHQCVNNITEIFTFSNCSYSMCSFDGVFQPRVTGSFMAFSAFYHTQKYIKDITNIALTSPSHAVEAAKLICNMTITELLHKANLTEKSVKYMKNLCSMSNFVQVLLTKGYHFDNTSFPHVSFEQNAAGASVGWALGYMLNVSNEVPAESLSVMKALPSGPWKGIIVIFIAFVLFVLGYCLMIYRNRND
ncbi:PREDICTED: ectonucleoside triphosphate diphosphohydrolase 2-like [Poecilia mexicana]|uniref:Ectonucleoside triphosphate diphosphohydrolase 2a, tandem duplicate 2 n=1 Tax=Poecilia mexicana TaxID=48701 RepID=A0A3B3YCS7_9TELE|nr:PREDICTED: ectonucleoside triphosphate diphosphohydrolase 2-like [Poecilia mexicana]